MAGLTKEQRAAKAAANGETIAEAQDESLVSVTKDGETLAVHPTCVKAHVNAGWKVTE